MDLMIKLRANKRSTKRRYFILGFDGSVAVHVLALAGIKAGGCIYARDFARAVAVLRLHGFEVEVEE